MKTFFFQTKRLNLDLNFIDVVPEGLIDKKLIIGSDNGLVNLTKYVPESTTPPHFNIWLNIVLSVREWLYYENVCENLHVVYFPNFACWACGIHPSDNSNNKSKFHMPRIHSLTSRLQYGRGPMLLVKRKPSDIHNDRSEKITRITTVKWIYVSYNFKPRN